MATTVLLVPHTTSHARSTWRGEEDERPLHPNGMRQAERLATEIGPVDAIYSSPSRRCVQTVEPLAVVSRTPIVPLDEMREAMPERADPWDWWTSASMRNALRGAYVAGLVDRVLQLIEDRHPAGRVAVCSHGDTIPIAIGQYVARHGIGFPALVDRGGWYELAGDTVRACGVVVPEP